MFYKGGTALGFGLVLVLAGTAAASGHGRAAERTAAAPAAVAIDGTAFVPPEVTIRVGQSVEWLNKDPFPHNVTFEADGPRSGSIAAGARWRWQGKSAGRFGYVCTLHPGMAGTIIVKR